MSTLMVNGVTNAGCSIPYPKIISWHKEHLEFGFIVNGIVD